MARLINEEADGLISRVDCESCDICGCDLDIADAVLMTGGRVLCPDCCIEELPETD